MTSIASTANAIGIADRPGERAVLMAVVAGVIRHAELSNAIAADVEVDDESYEALYVAGGLFRDGSIVGNSGRSQANLTRVLWLQFDADLLDWYGLTGRDDASKARRAEALADLGNLPQTELDTQIALLRASLEETFAAIGLPIHRLDYTGYGLCAYLYLAESDQTRIDDARALHAAIVGEANRRTPHLLDDQVKDAGTRVTRLPGSYNRKGTIPRLVTSLIPWNGDALPLGNRPTVARPVAHMIPASGPGMTADDTHAFVSAIAPAWNLGQKHAMGLATAAILAKARIPESQALAIVEHLAASDTKPWDRKSAVVSTYTKMRAGGAIAGYSALANLIDPSALAFVDTLLAKYRNATAGTVTMGAFEVVGGGKPTVEPQSEAAFSPTEIPDAARYGWIGDYIRLAEPTTESPDAYHMACGLALIGACIGRRVSFFHISERMLANFYVLLIGPSGRARKDTAIKRSLALPMLAPPRGSQFISLGIPFHLRRDISSAEGLISRLAKHPNLYLYVTEFSKLMHNATREATSSISPTLMDAFDGPPSLQNNVKRDEDSREAVNPFLTVMAAVQPEILSDLIGDSQQYSGFLNRWFLVVGDGKGPRPNPPNLDEVAGWTLMKRAMDAISSYPEGSAIGFAGESVARWESWYRAVYPSGDTSSQEDAMGIRLGTIVKKIALVHAVLDRAPEIRLAHLDAAIATVEWSWGHTRKLLPTWGESPDARLARKIVEVLARRGPMLPKRRVQQLAGNRSGPGVFARVVKSMVENGELIVTPENHIGIAPETEAC